MSIRVGEESGDPVSIHKHPVRQPEAKRGLKAGKEPRRINSDGMIQILQQAGKAFLSGGELLKRRSFLRDDLQFNLPDLTVPAFIPHPDDYAVTALKEGSEDFRNVAQLRRCGWQGKAQKQKRNGRQR